jgi:hypothetical protein
LVSAGETAVALVFGVTVRGIGVAVVAAGFAPASEVVVVAGRGMAVVVAVLEGGCDDCDLVNPPLSS